jgi:DNA-binding IclR family transcriptional regulator
MLPKSSQPSAAHTVPVLRKAIRLLVAVAAGSGAATTKSLAATLRISPTTCYRILQSFVAEGWLRSRAGGEFELSFGLVPLLRPLLRHELLIETIRDPLVRLAAVTGLTAKLTVPQGEDAVTIHSEASPKPTAITSRVGSVISLAIGSSGATLLSAHSDEAIGRILDAVPAEVWKLQKRVDVLRRVREARKQGYCFDSGSYQQHINTISAPLLAPDKSIVGAITLLGFPQDFSTAAKPALIRELKYTTGGCNELIQGHAVTANT